MVEINGFVEAGYGPIADAFRANWSEDDEVGAGFSLVHDGVVGAVAGALGYDLDAVFRLRPAPDHEHKHAALFPTPCTVRECLARYCDLTQAPRRSDLKLLASYATDPLDRSALLRMSSKEGKAEYREKIVSAHIGVGDIVARLCRSIEMPLEHFIAACPRLLPRYYTISSSSSMHPDSIHITVSVVKSALYAHHVNQSQWSESSRIISDVSLALDELAFGDTATAAVTVSSTSLKPVSTKRFQEVTPSRIAELWHIGPKAAERTSNATYTSGTTRSGLQHGLLGRKLRSGHQQVDLKRTKAKVYADHVHMQVKGYGGINGAMIFVTAYHFTDAYMYALRSMSATNAFKEFIQNCGIPETMVTDGRSSLIGEQWKELCRNRGIKQLTTEPYSHWQNLAEAGIRELKRLYL